ncbi:MAG TPA: ABC transporter substrate-binding protein [Candidatus Eisenbacteria bacterium]|jgi:NitT/TauT family transport system substrate-binding protein|nr:ABC transporter substrate-binding protein [Candidatus Eisenbacteria bacterium]
MSKLGLALLFLALAPSVVVEATDKVRMGFPDLAAQFLPLPLAEKRDFLKEQGLQGEFIRIRPAISSAALVSGEIDYDTVLGNGIGAAIRGLPVRVVACFLPATPIALISRSEFKSVQDLKGKNIGLNTFGGTLESIARLISKHYGLEPDKDIKFLATGTVESRFAAMQQGLTAATLGSPPIDFLGKKLGFVVLARANELFNFPASGLVASVRAIKEKPDQIKRVIKAGIKASRYIRQNREGTLPVMTEWLKIDKEIASVTYDSVWKAFTEDGTLPESGLRVAIDEARRVGKVERGVSFSEVADLSILREAQRELAVLGK